MTYEIPKQSHPEWYSKPKHICVVCGDKFYTDQGFEKHADKCEPYPDVHPSPRNFIKAAQTLAFAVHKFDTDKQGEPYKHHLQAVADGVKIFGGSDFAVAAAYLHDSVEDHGDRLSYQDLIDYGFQAEVVKIVEAVSKRNNEDQKDYLARVIAGGRDAMVVKLGDLLHNMRHDRHSAMDERTQARHKMKYRPAIARLLLELELITDEEGQAEAKKKYASTPQGTAVQYTGSYGNTWSSVGAGGSSYYKGHALVKGDWIAGYPAPLGEKLGEAKDKVTYASQAGGGTITVQSEKDYRIWTKSAWQAKITASLKKVRAKGGKDSEAWTPYQEKQEPKPTPKPFKPKSELPSPDSGKP